MTLAERARLRVGRVASCSERRQTVERGLKRLAKWKAQVPFNSGFLFQQRLEQTGLTETGLLELLSQADVAGSPLLEPPKWACEIDRALSDPSAKEFNLFINKLQERPELHFLEVIQPLIARQLHRLRKGIQDVARVHPTVAFEPEDLERLLFSRLPEMLLSVLVKTMALELNVARMQGLLPGETGEERFASFIKRIRWPEVRREIFHEYPIMGRLVMITLESWAETSLEFLQRWCVDLPAIRNVFSAGQELGPLARIESDAGDRHRGGRTVWIVECASGFKVVYKPKSLAVDQHFQELLGWLNERGLSAPFRPLGLLDRGAYGWEEFVSPHGCSSHDEVARFYHRTGGYVALLYALAATDFHHENVMAVGEHPVLLDLEALFHPSGLESASQQADEVAERSFGDSVLGSGMLPVPVWGGRQSGVFDLSGLGAELGRRIPMHAPVWKDKGTDQMHFAREGQVIETSEHRPTLNGISATPVDYLNEIETGFREVYTLLEKHHAELLAPGGLIDRFAEDEVRFVPRNSSVYAQLLQEGAHPDVLRDGLDRDRLFDRLWNDVVERPSLAQLIPAEVEDLWRGDIPLFTTQPRSKDLWAGLDRRIVGVLSESGLERARQRLDRFGGEDLKRQLWFLRGSLTTLASSTRVASRSARRPLAEPGVVCDRGEFLAASCAVGERLADTALHGAQEVSWVGLNMVGQQQWVLVPLGLDFYDGMPGIALFLGYLGSISGQERFTNLARAALETFRRKIEPAKRKKGFKQIGGFVGWGGILYTLAHLGVLWGESALLSEAHGLLEELPGRIEGDKDLDIISGAAGCIAGLLCVQACRPSARVLEVAKLCGEHLLARARQMPAGIGWESSFANQGPLTGFSHGAAGISWALLELAAQTGDERFRSAALAGIAYERSLFNAQAGNWPDLRVAEIDTKRGAAQKPEFPVAWCHGAPGIGLARLLCRRLQNDPQLDAEIETALRTTLANGFGYNHCLCHGDLGNLELLLAAAKTWPGSYWKKEGELLAAGVLKCINRDGWLCGNPLAVESPGLMTGLAGIGYGLLRCAEPSHVPSVVSLAPPIPVLQHA
jgi:type 2 lantibiotic biosynthesis protein LanM